MKKRTFFTAAAPVLVFTTVAFNTIKKNVDVEASTIEWTGKKITGSAHHGTIQLKDGYLNLTEDGNLIGGEFVMDMNTIKVTDLTGEYKEKLEGHLNNDDFFGVNNYATSKFVITEAKQKSDDVYTVTGDLTIKGKTEPVSFDMTVKENTASAKINIDRTKYGIRYGSGSFFSNLGDNTINNNFTLDVNLKF
ncbi:YceI family protein [Salinimicrobium oceani]|uniref:YceI family protein n=1 Tax=Salinimicrobium oceani TaxID=2722702 RepID=A0ABX1CW70_9FLAO|nr:YceI family protein [Salinimicrobium oceani]NJW52536.1 YceI family protein [Salinimicrobium oceani]